MFCLHLKCLKLPFIQDYCFYVFMEHLENGKCFCDQFLKQRKKLDESDEKLKKISFFSISSCLSSAHFSEKKYINQFWAMKLEQKVDLNLHKGAKNVFKIN